jgi:hypothetical protein
MSEAGLATVVLMVLTVMIVMSYWRQIAILILYLAVTVFCFGAYCIVSIIGNIV